MIKNKVKKKKTIIKDKRVNKEIKFASGEVKELVVAGLVLTALVGGMLITPNMPIVLGGIMKIVEELKKMKVPQTKVKRVLKDLEKNKIISIQQKGDEAIVYLKRPFHKKIIKYSIKSILDFKKRDKKWTGNWILVTFDVPEEQRNKRDYLRKFLSKVGFYKYQQSVYIFPYECEEEVALIKKIVEGGKYIRYIVAHKVEGEKALKLYFGLNDSLVSNDSFGSAEPKL